MILSAIVACSLVVSALGALVLLPRLRAAGMVGRDMNKQGQP